MRNSAIIDSFNGKRGHAEMMLMPKNDGANDETICAVYDELKEKLPPELFELHQKFVGAPEKNMCGEVDFYFAEGFK